MSAIEVIVAVKQSELIAIKEELRPDRVTAITPKGGRIPLKKSERKMLRSGIRGVFKKFKPTPKAPAFETFNFLIDEPEKIGKLKEITAFLKSTTGAMVIGAWNKNGTQYGTTIVPAVLDRDDNEVTPAGKPVYPLHKKFLTLFADDVTYDENGKELSRKPASKPKETTKIYGRADRIWNLS